MECIITGCALVAPSGKWVSGDLFQEGFAYIFNGNFKDNEVSWVFNEKPFYERQVHPTNWWERRGVFVFSQPNFNQAALAYLK